MSLLGNYKWMSGELEALLADGKQKLFDEREKRIKPGLDDKILTSWNGIMIRGMAMGYQLTGKPEYLEACEKSAEFVLTTLSQENGLLLRTYRSGKSHLNAYLEDYAYFIAGLIALYEASFEQRWLTEAERLAHIMIDQFGDDAGDGFFFTGKAHETLIVQSKSAYDGATPSGASMAIHSLLRLATTPRQLRIFTTKPLRRCRSISIKWRECLQDPGNCFASWCSCYRHRKRLRLLVKKGIRKQTRC